MFFPARSLSPTSLNASRRVLDGFARRDPVEKERVGAQSGEDVHALTSSAVLVVDDNRHHVTRRRGAVPLLHRRTLTVNRDIEAAVEYRLGVPDGERGRGARWAIVTGRSRNRHMTASENSAVGPANGKTLTTSTR